MPINIGFILAHVGHLSWNFLPTIYRPSRFAQNLSHRQGRAHDYRGAGAQSQRRAVCVCELLLCRDPNYFTFETEYKGISEHKHQNSDLVMFDTIDFLSDPILSKIQAGIDNTDPIPILVQIHLICLVNLN